MSMVVKLHVINCAIHLIKILSFYLFCDQVFSGGMELFKIITNPENKYVP